MGRGGEPPDYRPDLLSSRSDGVRQCWRARHALEAGRGELVAFLGANGAGKTSTLRGITGLVRPRAGTVSFAGQRIDGAGPTRAVELGMAHVPEGRRVFPGLSVADNLMLGGWAARRRRNGSSSGDALVFDMFPRLADRRAQLAGSLSGGEQQMLAIVERSCRAVAPSERECRWVWRAGHGRAFDRLAPSTARACPSC